jgi:hypothetical protein
MLDSEHARAPSPLTRDGIFPCLQEQSDAAHACQSNSCKESISPRFSRRPSEPGTPLSPSANHRTPCAPVCYKQFRLHRKERILDGRCHPTAASSRVVETSRRLELLLHQNSVFGAVASMNSRLECAQTSYPPPAWVATAAGRRAACACDCSVLPTFLHQKRTLTYMAAFRTARRCSHPNPQPTTPLQIRPSLFPIETSRH